MLPRLGDMLHSFGTMIKPGFQGLLDSCARGSALCCEQFFEEIQPHFRHVALRIARQYCALDQVDDLVQEMLLKISSNPGKFADMLPKHDGQAQAYLCVAAANTGRDFFRKQKRDREVIPLGDGIANLSSDYGFSYPQIERELLLNSIEAAIEGDKRDLAIFRLYYRQGYSVREIALIPSLGLSIKAAESVILRMSRRLKVLFVSPKETRAQSRS